MARNLVKWDYVISGQFGIQPGYCRAKRISLGWWLSIWRVREWLQVSAWLVKIFTTEYGMLKEVWQFFFQIKLLYYFTIGLQMRNSSKILQMGREWKTRVLFSTKSSCCIHRVATNFRSFKRTVNVYLIVYRSPQIADLFVVGPKAIEIPHATITLTPEEIKELDGRIVGCCFVDHRWILTKERSDRIAPSRTKFVLGSWPFHMVIKVF